MSNEYVVYKGETLICIGTRKECAAHMGVKTETLRGYNKPAYQRLLAKRKNARNYLTVEKLVDDETEEE